MDGDELASLGLSAVVFPWFPHKDELLTDHDGAPGSGLYQFDWFPETAPETGYLLKKLTLEAE